jgi:predicted nucleotidyltransferase
LLDFSRRSDLGLHAAVIGQVQAAAAVVGARPLIVGAFARDLHLVYAHAIPVQRQTEDLDLALAVPDWEAFEQIKASLLQSGNFSASKEAQRLRYGAMPLDLVPFGRVEAADGKIVWPPHGEVVMDVFGFREAQEAALPVALPGGVRTEVVSLAALALLKLVCWEDRHHRSPKKDASDLQLILTHYLKAGNERRLWDEFLPWTQEDDFDYLLAGARMLGHDIGTLLDGAGRGRITQLLGAQSGEEWPAALPREMDPSDPERPRRLVAAVLQGMKDRTE